MSYVSPKQLYTKEIKRFAMVTLVCIQYLNYLKRLHLIGCIMNYISVTKRPLTVAQDTDHKHHELSTSL